MKFIIELAEDGESFQVTGPGGEESGVVQCDEIAELEIDGQTHEFEVETDVEFEFGDEDEDEDEDLGGGEGDEVA